MKSLIYYICILTLNLSSILIRTINGLFVVGVYLSILLTGLSSLPRHHHDIEPGIIF